MFNLMTPVKQMHKIKSYGVDSNLNIRNHSNIIIVPKELKLKNIQREIRKPITPKCQFKWDTQFMKRNLTGYQNGQK